MTDEEDVELLVHLSVTKRSFRKTSDGMLVCNLQVTFGVDTEEQYESVADKLNSLIMGVGPNIHEEAIEVLKQDIEDLKAKHKEEIEQHLRASNLQNLELLRLRQLERQLGNLANMLKSGP